MKQYPSIGENYEKYIGQECIAQFKYDGSNLRCEWSKNKGWHKWGTRHQLFDPSDPLYGQAIPIFKEKYQDHLTWIIRNNPLFKGVTSVIAYMEFMGENSFAGEHVLNEPKKLILLDVNVGKKGFIDVFSFAKMFSHLDTPKILYRGILTRDFIKSVRRGENVWEGSVIKGGIKHNMWAVKVKSATYLEKLKEWELKKNAIN